MTHPMMMNCPHKDDSICLDCSHKYYTEHVIPLEEAAKEFRSIMLLCQAWHQDECDVDDIETCAKNALDSLDMTYPGEISNLCSKRNREIDSLKDSLKTARRVAHMRSEERDKLEEANAELRVLLEGFCENIVEDPLGVGIEHTYLLHMKHKALRFLAVLDEEKECGSADSGTNKSPEKPS